jgi:hypothetical protein
LISLILPKSTAVKLAAFAIVFVSFILFNYLNVHTFGLRCKGTTKKTFPQEGTLGWDSYPEVTIAMEWEEEKSGVNSD